MSGVRELKLGTSSLRPLVPTASYMPSIVLLGVGGVGKSAFTARFVQGVFVEKYDPTIEDSYRTSPPTLLVRVRFFVDMSAGKTFDCDGENYILEILDTAGTEQFSSMRDLYMKDGQVRFRLVLVDNTLTRAQGFILIYSITASSTLVALDEFYKQILKVKDLSEGSSVAMVIVGNKADLESDREVKRADAEAKAKVPNTAWY